MWGIVKIKGVVDIATLAYAVTTCRTVSSHNIIFRNLLNYLTTHAFIHKPENRSNFTVSHGHQNWEIYISEIWQKT